MADVNTLERKAVQFSSQLFGADTRSTLNPNWSTISMDGCSPVFLEASAAGEIAAMSADLGGNAVSAEMADALSSGHHTGTDGVALVDLPKLLKEIYPLGAFFEGGSAPTEEQMRLAAILETWAVKNLRSFDKRLVPTGGQEGVHRKARLLVDSVINKEDLGKLITSSYRPEKQTSTSVSYDPSLHPRSTALYAAATTNSLEDQVVKAASLDQLIWDIHDQPNLPVFGTSAVRDSWGQKSSFMVKAVSPTISINYYGIDGIKIPMAGTLELFDRNRACVHAIHRENGKADVYDGSPMEPALFYSRADFVSIFMASDDETAADRIVESETPFVSAARLMDENGGYDERYHRLFRLMYPNYVGQVAQKAKHPRWEDLVNSADTERQRGLQKPFSREEQVREVAAFVRFVTSNSVVPAT